MKRLAAESFFACDWRYLNVVIPIRSDGSRIQEYLKISQHHEV